MKIIETLSDKITDEIHDAKDYTQLAIQNREEYPDLAKTLYSISLEEMEHMNRLHEAVVEIIEAYKKDHGEPPAPMMAIYTYLHKKQIDAAAEVKAMQNMYAQR